MKLPPLPPMPRSRTASHSMPRLPALEVPPAVHEVDAVNPADAIEGRWFETAEKNTDWGGVCCVCGGRKRAINLRYAIGPFMRWEGWACEPCRKGRQGLERTVQAKPFHRPREQKLAMPIPQTPEARRYWDGVRRLEKLEISIWEGEGGATW